MNHKHLMFNTLKIQCVLRWGAIIEEFSLILHYIEGPCNILADNLSRLHRLIIPAQIAEGENLVEPAEVVMRKKTNCISWIKNTLGFTMKTSGNALSAISIYLTLHIRMRMR
jgi:hypothetical protein